MSSVVCTGKIVSEMYPLFISNVYLLFRFLHVLKLEANGQHQQQDERSRALATRCSRYQLCRNIAKAKPLRLLWTRVLCVRRPELALVIASGYVSSRSRYACPKLGFLAPKLCTPTFLVKTQETSRPPPLYVDVRGGSTQRCGRATYV